ncbi:MAG: RsmD family RNA methyltransferase [Bacteroidia bacterium]
MRIISGNLKGILIQPPPGLPVRPTTDRAKESLFNILANRFELAGIEVLDLFSGTGNMAYECCSRGAARVVAIDINAKCVDFIKSMKQKHQLGALTVRKADVFKYLSNPEGTYDIVFADAPYAHPQMVEIPRRIMQSNLLKATGTLVVEHESNLDLSHESGFFECRKYGQSSFSFFKHSPATI